MDDQKFDLRRLDSENDMKANDEFQNLLKQGIAKENAEKLKKGLPIACFEDHRAFLLWSDGRKEFIE
ncbi:MAG: hypothetical protein K0Q87_3435 [Neobacillus sp.]|nr:hypothetical protein [Neobacillus sp.]